MNRPGARGHVVVLGLAMLTATAVPIGCARRDVATKGGDAVAASASVPASKPTASTVVDLGAAPVGSARAAESTNAAAVGERIVVRGTGVSLVPPVGVAAPPVGTTITNESGTVVISVIVDTIEHFQKRET